ncbi:hypothetical protein DLAC_01977 [Tieghemostelium lacteum]|uniref:Uncharacterized protein n=1 Tax=Tieghemostelium lacteum TaxID=361077 RepID=A0A152A577_TIELA|nr:hypothetical protein DLAC_01977 [Tieghemostelium lacteum]|eukprot:KYR01388.1 hypothetical protein DLAC_01977 [Tieghemostelium lacteum]
MHHLNIVVNSQRCPDPLSDAKHEWSFYLSTKNNEALDNSKKAIYYFHSDSTEVKVAYLDKIKGDTTSQIYLFSDEGSSVQAHHKSIISLTREKKDSTEEEEAVYEPVGFYIGHSFPSMHEYVRVGHEAGISFKESQHMFCISLNSKSDVDTLQNIYNIIKPHFHQCIPDSPKTKLLFSDTYGNNADAECQSEMDGRVNTKEEETDPLTTTKELMDPSLRDPKCLRGPYTIGSFTFYASPLMPKDSIKFDPGTILTVENFGIDAWWKLTRQLQEKLLVVTHKDQGNLGSVYSNDVSLTNFIWDYGDEKVNGDSTHEKMAISTKTEKICIGDGNRHYTQNVRAGFYFCFTNTILHTYLSKKPKLFFAEEEPLLLNGKDPVEYNEELKALYGEGGGVLTQSKRKFLFKVKEKRAKVVRKLADFDEEAKDAYDQVLVYKGELELSGEMDKLMQIYANIKKKKPPTPAEDTMSPSRILCPFTTGCTTPLRADSKRGGAKKNVRCVGCSKFKLIPNEFFVLDMKYAKESGIEATKAMLAYFHLIKLIQLPDEKPEALIKKVKVKE